ncbi:ABC transporter substrate binding protein [Clostridium ganghwense]|uniref:ABC transporter substrate binding protein n=1 Tax=Clostridium ganghwense TaxID=312089 RepID=A0ABT4CUL5_9CLOT|nr:ABC transporter substrate binding protein [Clostridium ganghwense]MCY6372752.1 ABC transporter substrate binding protein [Clostridium ganghwense]
MIKFVNFQFRNNTLNKKMKVYLSIFLVVLVFILISINDVSYAENIRKEKKKILVINSYHHGLKWTDDIEKGIKTVFKNNKEVEFYFDYMDTKRNSNPNYVEKMHRLLEEKYKNKQFDGIIVSDDDAYNFILKYHKKIFPQVPVVFCGVDHLEAYSLNNKELFTGVISITNVKRTIEIALEQNVKTKNIIIINDKTSTGKSNKRLLDEIMPQFNKKVNFIFFEDMNMSDIRESVSKLSKDNIILLMSFNVDKCNNIFSYEESAHLISEKSNVPIYGAWDVYLGHGIVGGMLTNGERQGEVAGKLMLDIVNGRNPQDIPVVKENINKYMFDYTKLKQFHIDLNKLPMESYIINKPTSFLVKYKYVLLGSMFSLVIILLGIIIRKSIIEKKLKVHATIDTLTGVLNRRAGLELLEKQLEFSGKNDKYFKVTVCFIDINYLKLVNDTYGHHEGDKLIKATCRIISDSLRKSDILCRLGGDEFLIIFPRTDLKSARDILKNIDEKIIKHNTSEYIKYTISISRGIAEFDPINPVDIDTLIKTADTEMYRDKKRIKSNDNY